LISIFFLDFDLFLATGQVLPFFYSSHFEAAVAVILSSDAKKKKRRGGSSSKEKIALPFWKKLFFWALRSSSLTT